jgi:hypothetical protein
MLPWTPKVSYGSVPTVLLFSWPTNAWNTKRVPVGGGDEAASGIGTAIVIRNDQVAIVTLRFFESERDAVDAYVQWAQENRHLTHDFWFDQSDDDTMRTVRWHGPHAPEEFNPTRSQQFPGMLEFEIMLRTADGSRFGLNWSGH